MTRQTVAVIGAGVSGLTAAYILQKRFDVHVFEANSRLGGHADTRSVSPTDFIEMAFAVFNPIHHPNISRLLEELGITSYEVDLSTDVICTNCGFAHLGDDPLGSQKVPLRPFKVKEDTWRRFTEDSQRFLPELIAVLDEEPGKTVEQFLHDNGFSAYFASHFLYERLYAWLLTDIRKLPVRALVEYVGGLGFGDGPGAFAMHAVSGGSRTYIERIIQNLTAVKVSTPIQAVSRGESGVDLRDFMGNNYHFDKAVIAVHADQALSMLSEPTPEERAVLGAIKYSAVDVIVHTDEDMIPVKSSRSSMMLQVSCANSRIPSGSMHGYFNRMLKFSSPTRYYVSYTAPGSVDSSRVLERETYDHPNITPEMIEAQRRMPDISDDVIAFAGAYHGAPTHESGCKSGIAAAAALGADWD